jgi:hypothetical protein
LLHDTRIRPGFGHGAHVLEAAGREALHLGEGLPQIARESIDDLAAPAELGLSRQEVAADAPVEEHQLAVGLQRCAVPRLDDAGLQRFEERVVRGVGGDRRPREGLRERVVVEADVLAVEGDPSERAHADGARVRLELDVGRLDP